MALVRVVMLLQNQTGIFWSSLKAPPVMPVPIGLDTGSMKLNGKLVKFSLRLSEVGPSGTANNTSSCRSMNKSAGRESDYDRIWP